MGFFEIMGKVIGIIYGVCVAFVIASTIPLILFTSLEWIIFPIILFVICFIPLVIYLSAFGMGVMSDF